MSKKSWREKLAEIGGYENAILGINAGAVREIIKELEDCGDENERLRKRVLQLETHRVPSVREEKEP